MLLSFTCFDTLFEQGAFRTYWDSDEGRQKREQAERAAAAAYAAPEHEANEWGIEASGGDDTEGPVSQLPTGLEFSLPKATEVDLEVLRRDGVQTTEQSVEELMAALQALSE